MSTGTDWVNEVSDHIESLQASRDAHESHIGNLTDRCAALENRSDAALRIGEEAVEEYKATLLKEEPAPMDDLHSVLHLLGAAAVAVQQEPRETRVNHLAHVLKQYLEFYRIEADVSIGVKEIRE